MLTYLIETIGLDPANGSFGMSRISVFSSMNAGLYVKSVNVATLIPDQNEISTY